MTGTNSPIAYNVYISVNSEILIPAAGAPLPVFCKVRQGGFYFVNQPSFPRGYCLVKCVLTKILFYVIIFFKKMKEIMGKKIVYVKTYFYVRQKK